MNQNRSIGSVSSAEKTVRRLGVGIVLAVFIGFFVWSAFAPISSAVVAPGEVRVEFSRVKLQHLEGGLLKRVYVRDGDTVKVGDPLIELDPTVYRSEFELLSKQSAGFMAAEARLIAERDGLAGMSVPTGFDANDPQNATLLVNERALMAARQNSYEKEMAVLRERLRQVDSQTSGLKIINANKRAIRDSLASEAADLRRLVEREFISRHRLNQTERQLSVTESEISENEGNMANLAVQRSEAFRTLEYREAERRTSILNDLTESQKRLNELSSRLQAVTDRLNRTTMRATAEGQVLGLQYRVPGAVLPPGAAVVDILPPAKDLQIEVRIDPNDIDSVVVGRQADIRMVNHNAAIIPVVKGEVVYIAGDRLMDEKLGLTYFPARIQVTTEGLGKLLEAGVTLSPGVPVQVVIKTGERTLFQYLMRPLSNVFATALTEK